MFGVLDLAYVILAHVSSAHLNSAHVSFVGAAYERASRCIMTLVQSSVFISKWLKEFSSIHSRNRSLGFVHYLISFKMTKRNSIKSHSVEKNSSTKTRSIQQQQQKSPHHHHNQLQQKIYLSISAHAQNIPLYLTYKYV